jgi:hypothetical protein
VPPVALCFFAATGAGVIRVTRRPENLGKGPAPWVEVNAMLTEDPGVGVGDGFAGPDESSCSVEEKHIGHGVKLGTVSRGCKSGMSFRRQEKRLKLGA